MKKSMIPLAVMALFSSHAVLAANVQGGSSDPTLGKTLVEVGVSDHSWFTPNGFSGLRLNNHSKFIDLYAGPIKGSNNAIAGGADSLGNYYL